MLLTFTSARKENDPEPLPHVLLTPGCLCIITLNKLNRKISNKLTKESEGFDFHVHVPKNIFCV